ncbi:ABC transporter permease [Patescibacteria group bacterium]|nr:ABC transporter permease [Patescibacteria group bacterium]
MFVTNTKRITKSAIINLWRSRIVSMSSILVMSITLFVFGTLIFSNAALDSALTQIQEKVDINVYFTVSAPEEEILSLKKSLESLPEVGTVEYVSREESLEKFRERHGDDQLTLQALDELEDNPLGAVLNIQAKETSQYETIASFLNSESVLSSEGTNLIDKVNYYQNKIVIDKLSKIISSSQKIGFIATLILVIMSIIITFNTIRLTIYIAREEISIMRLVGASNEYVRGPFVVAGVVYGLISAGFTLLVFLPLTYYIGSFTQRLFGLNMFEHYLSNFWNISIIIIFSGVTLGIISSYLAVRKYLKV